MINKIGFIQGRLSPIIDGKIQAFPWDYWQDEFRLANEINLSLIEWTLDQDRLLENPFLVKNGQKEIKQLMGEYNIKIPSLTGDFFMHTPFFKAQGKEKLTRLDELKKVLEACLILDTKFLVIPLVDNGGLKTQKDEESLYEGLQKIESVFKNEDLKIIFESDYQAQKLATFITNYYQNNYGINYDIGNSAALGFDYQEELDSYFDRIDNVHIKDRVLGGTTVALGTGAANLSGVLDLFKRKKYQGNYIMQTARAKNNEHQSILNNYKNMITDWLG